AAGRDIGPDERDDGRRREDGGGSGLGAQELAQRRPPARGPRGTRLTRSRRLGGGNGLLWLGHASIVAEGPGPLTARAPGLPRYPGRPPAPRIAPWLTISRISMITRQRTPAPPTGGSPWRSPSGATG